MMIGLKNFNIEYKSSILFGIVALISSLLTGIIAGIKIDTILLRVLLLTPVFAGIGYGIIYIIKLFVPEVYAILTGEGSSIHIPDDKSEHSISLEDDSSQAVLKDKSNEEPVIDEFKELSEGDLPKFDSIDDIVDSKVDTKSGKLGKHIVIKDKQNKFVKYEPKIMAQAVRTMLKKDDN